MKSFKLFTMIAILSIYAGSANAALGYQDTSEAIVGVVKQLRAAWNYEAVRANDGVLEHVFNNSIRLTEANGYNNAREVQIILIPHSPLREAMPDGLIYDLIAKAENGGGAQMNDQAAKIVALAVKRASIKMDSGFELTKNALGVKKSLIKIKSAEELQNLFREVEAVENEINIEGLAAILK